jgi:tetratricopeptide (TPR) repeat protein
MRRAQRTFNQTVATTIISISAATISTFSINTFAQSTDADFTQLIKTRNIAGLETLARERLAKNSKDDVALWYLGRAVAGDEKKRGELIPRAEQCIKEMPQSARCHSALGSMYGVLASSGGMTAGMKYAGKIKDMFLKAVELDPKNFDMRRDLNQYYLIAPGIVGGSVKRAIENSNDFAKIDPARGQLLRAEAHIYEKEFAKAETLLRAIKSGDADVAESVVGAINSVGFGMISANEAALAQKLFERQIALDAKNANAHFGLGRALLEQKNVDGAIASMERALQIEPKTNAHYRLGIAYQTKGDKAKATAAFQQFLTYQKTGKAVEDANKRLEEMKKG